FILGLDMINLYGIDIHTYKGPFFTVGGFKQSFAYKTERSGKQTNMQQRHSFFEALEGCQISPDLTQTQRDQLLELLCEMHQAFAYGDQPLGTAKDIEMHIDLTVDEDKVPPSVNKRPYPMSPAARKDTREAVDKLMELGVIRE
ncbi:hypothetical protein BT69DRAFT_1204422, partial [Atractiella rhizophila]